MKNTCLHIAAILLCLCSCDQVGNLSDLSEEQQEELSSITFKYDVNLWKTERMLEPGDKAGIFAGSPVNADNLLASVSQDGTLQCSQPVRWDLAKKVSSITFAAYSPYSGAYQTGSGTFTVMEDQSTEAAVKASDLVVASLRLTSRENQITFSFSHKMVRLALYFDNRSGADIESVTVSGVSASTSVNLAKGEVSLSTSVTTSIKAGQYVSSESETYYSVLIAPQKARPSIRVNMKDGTYKTFVLDSQITFDAGNQWDNENDPLVIDTTSDPGKEEPVEFSLSINDWNNGGSMDFVKQ
ncbi:MAG: fimbrillin family protein [Bacteroidaceae bacterium]|nr:fimbrillin family protein [Bacteroidaceae bacterium]